MFLNKLIQYTPPIWCKRLEVKPNWRIPLGILPTPIHEWKLQGIPKDVKLFIKRDDMTGSTLGGNKVRCLEFLLADAKQRGYSGIITSGSSQSNHCAATAIACNQLGLDCHLLLYDQDNDIKNASPNGNSLRMQIAEPNMYLLPWKCLLHINDEYRRIKELSSRIFQTTGKTSYIIPRGGSSILGTWGYIEAWREMIEQKVQNSFDDIVIACGSGGSSTGLAIANYLTGSRVRIHAISVARSKEYMRKIIQQKMTSLGITEVSVDDVIDICADYVGGGYSIYKNEDIAFHKKVAATTGVYCDALYTGKAINGLMNELYKNPTRFKGNRILFIHTGGLFSMMQEKTAPLYRISEHKLKNWNEVFPEDNVF